jgi:hypothetical protein
MSGRNSSHVPSQQSNLRHTQPSHPQPLSPKLN